MKKKLTHKTYYLTLIGVFLIGLLLIMYFSPDKNMQFLIVIGMAISYVILGIIHHLLSHDLVLKIVIEYILIATLGVTLIYFVFKGGLGI